MLPKIRIFENPKFVISKIFHFPNALEDTFCIFENSFLISFVLQSAFRNGEGEMCSILRGVFLQKIEIFNVFLKIIIILPKCFENYL